MLVVSLERRLANWERVEGNENGRMFINIVDTSMKRESRSSRRILTGLCRGKGG